MNLTRSRWCRSERLTRSLLVAGLCSASIGLTGFDTLHSFPGASKSIYLDFDGHTQVNWPYESAADGTGRTVTIPAYHSGVPSSWTPTQIAEIEDIWRRVAEDYSPFDVDVTTQPPASFADGVAIRIAIGGSITDVSPTGTASGLAPPRAFRDASLVNVVLVAKGGKTTQQIASTASHEAGHALGLNYHYENAGRVPSCPALDSSGAADAHMAHATYAYVRDKWHRDQGFGSDGLGHTSCIEREDVAWLMASLGLRPDDHEDSVFDSGTGLVETTTGVGDNPRIVHAEGVIGMNDASWPTTCAPWETASCGIRRFIWEDVDLFRFRARAGVTGFTARVSTINVSPSDRAANLDADLELWRKDGTTWNAIQLNEDPGDNTLDAQIRHSPTHSDFRDYAVVAKSKGGYGDLGQYSVRVSGAQVRPLVMNVTGGDEPELGDDPGGKDLDWGVETLDSPPIRATIHESTLASLEASPEEAQPELFESGQEETQPELLESGREETKLEILQSPISLGSELLK